jgi:hypothetical protein
MFRQASLEEALRLLGDLLADRGQHFEVVAIGGGALQMIGVIDRPTKDIDLVAMIEGKKLVSVGTALPLPLAEAVADVARSLSLAQDWMNGGPTSLLHLGLPIGFQDRLQHRNYGGGLGLSLASRFDQIHFKLYAAADGAPGGKHHADLKRLKPSRAELEAAARWAKTHDPSEGFATMVAGVLRDFGVED